MNKKKKILLGIFVILAAILILILKTTPSVSSHNVEETIKQEKAENRTIIKEYTGSLEASSGLTEQIELHATYYFSELCVDTNMYIKEGTNLIKYTNGKYLEAPYDLIVKSYSLPNKSDICTYSHYIEVQSVDTLSSNIEVDEIDMEYISIGKEVKIKLNAYEENEYKGYVTYISEVAENSKFSVTITFINDGNIKLGMSGSYTVIFEQVVDVVAIPIEAVIKNGDKKYVKIIDENGIINEQEVETGLSDANFVEIKSGVNVSDTVEYVSKM